MQLKIENLQKNPVNLLRRAGYSFQKHVENEMSFIRPLALAGYPRFHMYVHVENTFTLVINIHLDQKKETYGDNTRHHGEYENEGALKKEIERILPILQSQ
ncbi:MAG: hypothetical protein UR60_C0007G0007 [Candidatus Moranbacteria bacterium GW2011_GWF2_34_56]|nr:MAG: hypothetical protein UR51_C0001G0007 [Candidatus Moranbacteria bacterium GW2011_GWF1_34_10]KKP65157.1 MAG: hypothetical protein UR60_C0007G0007 [Candidatus Moranbacteria bacterium GW2011_GWF2_34_56]HBI17383.1 hypothetical protein [Candidatus Moranbacteria bacterium]